MFDWNGFLKAKLHFGGAQTYPCPGHVELDGADDHQDEQTAEWDLRQRPLRVPWDVL